MVTVKIHNIDKKKKLYSLLAFFLILLIALVLKGTQRSMSPMEKKEWQKENFSEEVASCALPHASG